MNFSVFQNTCRVQLFWPWMVDLMVHGSCDIMTVIKNGLLVLIELAAAMMGHSHQATKY